MSLYNIPAGPIDIICCYAGSPVLAVACRALRWAMRFHNKRVCDYRLVQLDPRAIIPIKNMLASLLKNYRWDNLRIVRDFLRGCTWRGSHRAYRTLAALAHSKTQSWVTLRHTAKAVFSVQCADQLWEVHFVSGIAQNIFALTCFLRQPQYITTLYCMEELLFVMHKDGRIFATRAFDHTPLEVRYFLRNVTADCVEDMLLDRAIKSGRCQRCNRLSLRPESTFKNKRGNPGLGSTCFNIYKRSGMCLIIQRRAHGNLTQFSEPK